jgi:hypothetical protein
MFRPLLHLRGKWYSMQIWHGFDSHCHDYRYWPQSVIGKVCCDWERGIGDPICPLLVTDDGVCTCPQDPTATAAIPSDADEPTPTLAPVPSTLRLNSWWFHPTTTIHHDDHHPTNWWNTHPTNNHHDDHHDDHYHHHDDHYHHHHDDFWGIH